MRPAIAVVRPKFLALLVEHVDMDLENGQGERIKATALRAS
jgi:hypothetical protein